MTYISIMKSKSMITMEKTVSLMIRRTRTVRKFTIEEMMSGDNYMTIEMKMAEKFEERKKITILGR